VALILETDKTRSYHSIEWCWLDCWSANRISLLSC